MSIYHYNIVQGEEPWHDIKRGRVSSSNASKVLAKGQGKIRTAYMYQLVAERLSGLTENGYTSNFMTDGLLVEPKARSEYEIRTGNEVKEVGFIELNEDVGVSPDGVIGDDGLIEIKCPKTTTFIDYAMKGKTPSVYVPQMQMQLWVCEREWCDFVCFDPRIKNGYFCVRVERDETYIRNLIAEVSKFVNEVKELENKLK